MTPLEIGIIGCIALFIILVTSLPVGFVMAAVGTIGFAFIVSPSAALSVLSADIFETFSSYSLTVIPLFVFMGQIAFHSGISGRLFDAAYHWLGALPGGLAISTVGACTAFGAICGSGPATAATMAAVSIPEMKKYNYSMELAMGTVAAGGSLGMMIPPSVVFIVYGIMTEQSIGALFLAGILPGAVIAGLFCLYIYIDCLRHPEKGPTAPRFPLSKKLASLKGVIETLLLFLVVMGGMFAGIFTPTEGAAIGALGALGIAAVRGKLTKKMLVQSLLETLRTSCMVMVIVAGAVVFGHFLAVSRIPYAFAELLSTLPLPSFLVMGIIILFYLFAGCFVDALALVLLTIPIFYPVILELGYNPVWFGVIVVVVTQMGVISPPVGVNVYIVSGTERSIPLQSVFRGALPFLFMLCIAAVLFIIFPQICLVLPGLFY